MSANTITKSIRLSTTESAEIGQLSTQTALSEAALMKKWVMEGMQAQKMDLAVYAYMRNQVDLRGGAIMADVAYNRFLRELQTRRVVILEDETFLDRLPGLAEAFNDDLLRQALADLAGSTMSAALVENKTLNAV
ncbi:MAG: hypothetical protein KBG20_10470 [Caldilineaceae bacterium]|nr:hypothetical protein [Caldilineaceae bacterium]MBP8106402.1 hypothetical protein [Caldilineaceae bacterium]MBP8121415.1 hypothetical protein [Caldilineaceae bacterium]MBP9072717.1 hypothetical protein [Caldilineaceae bacterium]